MAMAIDLLSAILPGAENSRSMGSFWKVGDGRIQGTGFFLGVFDPATITDPTEFQRKVAEYIDEMKSAALAEGASEVLVAGEPEQRKYEAALKNGIKISDIVAEDLRKTGEAAGVPFLCEKG